MKIKRQKKIEFNTSGDIIYDSGELRKAILWYSDKPVARLKGVYLHGEYPAVSIYDKKIHIHRLLMMYWEQRDLERHEYVHHKNGNKLNALRENLEIVFASEHQSNHLKGKKQTKEHVEKRIKATTKTRYGH